jgi:hypothetical protein
MTWVQFLVEAGFFSSTPHPDQFWINLASYLMDTKGSNFGGKAAGE